MAVYGKEAVEAISKPEIKHGTHSLHFLGEKGSILRITTVSAFLQLLLCCPGVIHLSLALSKISLTNVCSLQLSVTASGHDN